MSTSTSLLQVTTPVNQLLNSIKRMLPYDVASLIVEKKLRDEEGLSGYDARGKSEIEAVLVALGFFLRVIQEQPDRKISVDDLVLIAMIVRYPAAFPEGESTLRDSIGSAIHDFAGFNRSQSFSLSLALTSQDAVLEYLLAIKEKDCFLDHSLQVAGCSKKPPTSSVTADNERYGFDELQNMSEEELSALADYMLSAKTLVVCMKSKNHHAREKVAKLLQTYQERLSKCKSLDEKLDCIIELISTLERYHPFYDGNGRIISIVLLSVLLVQNDFPIPLQENPNFVDYFSKKELKAHLIKALQATKDILNGKKCDRVESSEEDKEISERAHKAFHDALEFQFPSDFPAKQFAYLPAFDALPDEIKNKFLHLHGVQKTPEDVIKCKELLNACQDGDIKKVKQLLVEGVTLDMPDRFNNTPLNYAMWRGHSEIAKALVDAGASLDGLISPNSPLEDAEKETIQALSENLRKFINNKEKLCSIVGWTRDEESIGFLLLALGVTHLQKLNPNKKQWADFSDETKADRNLVLFLFIDVCNNFERADNLLGEHAIKILKEFLCQFEYSSEDHLFFSLKIGRNKNTLLHFFCRSGHKELATFLIKMGVNLAETNEDNSTPLHLAAGYGHVALVRALLEFGADTEALDLWGRTPLDWAKTHLHEDVIKAIYNHAKHRRSCEIVDTPARLNRSHHQVPGDEDLRPRKQRKKLSQKNIYSKAQPQGSARSDNRGTIRKKPGTTAPAKQKITTVKTSLNKHFSQETIPGNQDKKKRRLAHDSMKAALQFNGALGSTPHDNSTKELGQGDRLQEQRGKDGWTAKYGMDDACSVVSEILGGSSFFSSSAMDTVAANTDANINSESKSFKP